MAIRYPRHVVKWQGSRRICKKKTCIKIITRTFHEAGLYVSKQLTRKLVWVRASALNADMCSDIEVLDLKDIEADQEKWFEKVPDIMKASTLSLLSSLKSP